MINDVNLRYDRSITEEDRKIFSMFRDHEIYKKFKEKYPNSTEDTSPNNVHSLRAEYSDDMNNSIMLMMIFDKENYHYYYQITCDTDRPMRYGGLPGILAFEYLDNSNCIPE